MSNALLIYLQYQIHQSKDATHAKHLEELLRSVEKVLMELTEVKAENTKLHRIFHTMQAAYQYVYPEPKASKQNRREKKGKK
jgi:hypothetical protein